MRRRVFFVDANDVCGTTQKHLQATPFNNPPPIALMLVGKSWFLYGDAEIIVNSAISVNTYYATINPG